MFLVVFMFVNHAFANKVVFNQSFDADEAVVISPGVINIITTFGGKTELAKFNYYIDAIDYRGSGRNKCDEGKSLMACEKLKSFIKDKRISFLITEFDELNNVFTGQLYVNEKSIKDEMIRNGWYRYDYRKGRSLYLSILQKEAKCNARGIWKKRFSPLTEQECN